MKSKLSILLAAVAIVLAAIAVRSRETVPAASSQELHVASGFCSDASSEGRYTDFNQAFIPASSASGISSARIHSASAAPRHSGACKRNAAGKYATNFKSGKSLGPDSVHNFHLNIGLFPSGFNSRSHSIRMCSLII
ncbi:MAG: hypothetical protein K2J62_02970 [Bacteroidales bacterium]|nr:hypothetical protein [Bacteroidales bacterium]MDE6871069.1 hypothetical protein [Bacteroidales bacterium]